MPDKIYLDIKFERVFGKRIDWKNPKTFSEKLQWLKVYDRNPEYSKMVDKAGGKCWIADKVGDSYGIKTLGVWNNFDEIDFNVLPDRFVLKTAHDSGTVVVVKDKSKFDVRKTKQKLEAAQKIEFWRLSRERVYKGVVPRIICEEYLEDESGNLTDYKFYCFDGEPKLMYIAKNFGNPDVPHYIDYYDMDFKHLNLIRHYANDPKGTEKPEFWDKMKELSAILSQGLPFLRVDFYIVKGKLYIGELTFFPGAGMEKMEPAEWDVKMGKMLNLPNLK